MYLASDCWLQLFYQLVKIYQFSRISPKALKQVALNEPVQLFPAYYEQSSLYSGPETVLLRWLELHSQAERIVNPELELKDCVTFAQVPFLISRS